MFVNEKQQSSHLKRNKRAFMVEPNLSDHSLGTQI